MNLQDFIYALELRLMDAQTMRRRILQDEDADPFMQAAEEREVQILADVLEQARKIK